MSHLHLLYFFFIFFFVQVGADDKSVLDQIIDSLTSLANPNKNYGSQSKRISVKVGEIQESGMTKESDENTKSTVLIIGAGRVCRPAAEFLTSVGNISSRHWLNSCKETDIALQNDVQVLVASLYLKDAEEV